MEKAKRRPGDRKDGRLLRELDPMHYIVPLLYPNRCDNEAFISERIDLTAVNAYLERKNADDPEYKYNLFQVIVTSVLKILTLRPKMNRFIANKNVYQRNEISAAFVVKKLFTDDGAEALAFIHAKENDTIDTVHQAIYDQVSGILRSANIEYLKWDFNRSIFNVYSHAGLTQGQVLYDYVLGLYDFLERLNRDFPDMLIEGCSGGGGRFDMGMLYYTPQIWCSDNTDAIDRLRIQYGTSFVYPVSSVGAHVSAVPNEQTGRTVALSTRGLVAMGGTFGYELDPAKLSDAEKDQIRQQILDFKKYAHLITHGLYYRLSNPFSDGIAAWEMFAEDQSEALISVVCLEVHGNMTVNYVRLRGLRKDCFYRDEATGKEYPANALMQIGLPVPVEMGEYRSYRWHFRLVKKAELSAAE